MQEMKIATSAIDMVFNNASKKVGSVDTSISKIPPKKVCISPSGSSVVIEKSA